MDFLNIWECKDSAKFRLSEQNANLNFHFQVTDWATLKMKPRISISTQRHRDTEFLFFSVSLYLCVVFIYGSVRNLSKPRAMKTEKVKKG